MKLVLHIFLALAIVSGSESAQKHRGPPDEKRERLETVIIGKFAEELELTPAQAEKFYPRLRQYRSETDDLQRLLGEFELASKTRLSDGEFSTLDLSGGQRKRLALVVALLEKRPILRCKTVVARSTPCSCRRRPAAASR